MPGCHYTLVDSAERLGYYAMLLCLLQLATYYALHVLGTIMLH